MSASGCGLQNRSTSHLKNDQICGPCENKPTGNPVSQRVRESVFGEGNGIEKADGADGYNQPCKHQPIFKRNAGAAILIAKGRSMFREAITSFVSILLLGIVIGFGLGRCAPAHAHMDTSTAAYALRVTAGLSQQPPHGWESWRHRVVPASQGTHYVVPPINPVPENKEMVITGVMTNRGEEVTILLHRLGWNSPFGRFDGKFGSYHAVWIPLETNDQIYVSYNQSQVSGWTTYIIITGIMRTVDAQP